MSARERDALVAEKVMGHQVIYSVPDNYGHAYTKIKRRIGAVDCPYYTEKISAAWEVVEKMRSLGWYPEIIYDPDSTLWQVWMSHAALDASFQDDVSVTDAICLSALRAVGVDI